MQENFKFKEHLLLLNNYGNWIFHRRKQIQILIIRHRKKLNNGHTTDIYICEKCDYQFILHIFVNVATIKHKCQIE